MASIKFTNFAHSLLAVGIGPGDTSISVTGGHGVRFPALGAGEYFYATLEDASNNREIVKVTARATDVLTVVRAQDNTSALSWNAGDTIALRLNAAAITDFIDTVVNTVAKTSSTGSAVVPSGTVAQRDGSPAAGYFRYNADNTAFEGYVGAVWREFVLRTSGTGSLLMPSGTTAQRDGSPAFGYTRANSTLTQMEWWNGATWASFADQVTSLNGGQLAGMRNKIINGKMEIAQRGTSFVSPVTGSYMLDRWQHQSVNDGAFTVTQSSDVPADNELQSSLRLAVTTADASIAAGQFCTLRQPIEGYNVRDLIGRTFTLSFRVRSSKTGTHCVAFINDAGDRSYIAEYTINAANTWETKSITVSGGLITAGTWNWTTGRGLILSFALAAGSTYQTTAGAWQTGNFMATASQVNCLDTVGNIFAITGVQLEVGSVATPFEHRPVGAELALCQRYFFPGSVYWTGNATTSARAGAQVWFPVPMRAVPTFGNYTTTVANGFPTSVPTEFGPTTQGVTLDVIANATTLDGRWAGTFTYSAEL